eukprot:Gb_34079 [translate_table: standard]
MDQVFIATDQAGVQWCLNAELLGLIHCLCPSDYLMSCEFMHSLNLPNREYNYKNSHKPSILNRDTASGFVAIQPDTTQNRRIAESCPHPHVESVQRLDSYQKGPWWSACSRESASKSVSKLLFVRCSYQSSMKFPNSSAMLSVIGGTHPWMSTPPCPATCISYTAYGQNNELDYGGDELSMSPIPQYQHQPHGQQQNQFSIINSQMSSGAVGQAMIAPAPRSGLSEQNKNSVFSNALSSPVRRSLQPFHIAQGGYYSASNVPQGGNGGRRFGIMTDSDHGGFHGGHSSGGPQHGEPNGITTMDSPVHMYGQQSHQNRDAYQYSENDSTMDMHADSPAHFYQ